MKIKHKKTGVELAVSRHSTNGFPYYVTTGGSLIYHSDQEWELVEAKEEWEAVTHELTVQYKHEGNSIGYIHGATVVYTSYGYRLSLRQATIDGAYLIVERRKKS